MKTVATLTSLTPTKPLVLDGVPTAVAMARLGVRLSTNAWNKRRTRLDYSPTAGDLEISLSIRVDEHSGEDGAAEPMIQCIPVALQLGRIPRLDELPGITVEAHDDEAWAAWYGNDAPRLEENRLTFLAWTHAGMELDWTATYQRSRRRASLRFQGTAQFSGVDVSLRDESHLRPFVEKVWGEGAVDRFEIRRAGEHAVTLWPRFLSAGHDSRP